MATWEDGPEYAPVERPAEFAPAAVPPLPVAPPPEQMAAYAPKSRPVFDDPPVPVAPLATLVPPVADRRDPREAFDVVSTAVTSTPSQQDSAWGALHWGPPAGPPAGGGPWVQPPAALPQAPDQPFLLSTAAQRHALGGNFPAPGTPDWFGPGPAQPPPQPQVIGAKEVFAAATPGLCICLLVGGLIYVIAPVILGICLGLVGRVGVAQASVRRTLLIGVGFLALVAVLSAFGGALSFADWWATVGGWALLVCWVVLGVTLLLVYRGLKSTPGASAPRSPWG